MITIDTELQNLIPALSNDEYQGLENSLLAEGCRDPIVIWNGIVVDGHNRYKICTQHDIEYKTIQREFASRDECKLWMIDNQFNRRNLPSFVKGELALKAKPVMAAIAKEKKLSTLKQNVESTVPKKSGERTKKKDNETQVAVAKKANLSHDTLSKIEVILAQASPEVIQELREEKVSINKVYKDVTGKQTYSDIAKKIKEQSLKTQSEINIQSIAEFNVKTGDVYLINNRHKLIIEDSKNIDTIKKIIGNVDCVVTDPPYGISYKSPTGNGLTQRGDYAIIEGDNEEFNPNILFEYSDKVLTWGFNHYANLLPNSAGFIVWDKRDGDAINNNSDCEIAWTNMLSSGRLFHHKWNGMIKESEKGDKRIHPTQKPIALFEYCIDMCRCGSTILDLYAGSGSLLIACENTKRTAIVVEISHDYAAAMLSRFSAIGYSIEKI